MTDLNEKLKIVATYIGLSPNSKFVPRYQTDYNDQIPVWQKVCKEFLDMEKCTDDLKQFMLFKEKYCKLICYGTPLESFEILVQAIQFINNLKQK